MKSVFFLILNILIYKTLVAQNINRCNLGKPKLIYENCGQIFDQFRIARSDIKLHFATDNFKLSITNKGMSYELVNTKVIKTDTSISSKNLKDSIYYEAERIDIEFINSNPEPVILKEGKNNYYENFYYENKSKSGVTKVYGYSKAKLQNVWHNIDIEFIIDTISNKSIKYNFIIKPGGDINDIQLRYKGVNPELTNNTLNIKNSIGIIKESIPIVYYDTFLNEKKSDIEVFYKQTNNIISFISKNKLHTDKTLIIDPKIEWSTYIGGNNEDFGSGISIDFDDNIYILGNTNSSSGIATTGSYMTKFGGISDAFITKVSKKDTLVWSTYFGGKEIDLGNGLTNDCLGNIYVVGLTYSSSGIATVGSYSGNGDVFLAKFSSIGNRLWSTYLGGTGKDVAYSVKIHDSSIINIAGITNSTSGIATINAHQINIGGANDNFIAQYTTSGNLNWSTYYGGISNESAGSVAVDQSNNIYLSATTQSNNNIATAGSYMSAYGGNTDSYIAKFSNSGSLIWGTYFGWNSFDESSGISTNSIGDIFIIGRTGSSAGISTIGAFQTSLAGGSDGFISKFNSNGQLLWSTYFGGEGWDSISNLYIDTFDFVYLTGYTNSYNGIATSQSYQNTKNNAYDGFIAKFTSDGKLYYSSYYGGNKQDVSRGVVANSEGIAYILGYTFSDSNISLNGFYHQTLTGVEDAFLTKFNFKFINDVSIKFDTITSKIECTDTNFFVVKIKNNGLDTLKSDSIFWSVNGNIQKPYYWTGKLIKDSIVTIFLGSFNYSSAGTYILKSWSKYPNGLVDSLIQNDTCIVKLNIGSRPFVNLGNDTSICSGLSITLGSTQNNNYQYFWQSNPNGFTNNNSKITVKPLNSIYYILEVKDNQNGCTNKDSIYLIVNLKPVATINCNSLLFCNGDSAMLSTDTYKKYLWNTKAITNSIYTKIGGSFYVIVTDSNGCKDTSNIINLTLLQTPKPIISNNNGLLKVNKFNFYQWFLNDTALLNSNIDTLVPLKSGNYSVLVHDSNGCHAKSKEYLFWFNGYDNIKKQGVHIFPNPTQGDLTLSFNYASKRALSIYNSLGMSIENYLIFDDEFKIHLKESLSKGVYYLYIYNNDNFEVYKILKE